MSYRITEVRLLNVPLEKDYKQTLYFNSREEQEEYFLSRSMGGNNNFEYQRQDNIIRYPSHIDKIRHCNYVMYKNSAYTNKWFYAFITELEYKNDEVTIIHIETDVIQTWFFDYQLKTSFVEREHVRDDSVGLNTVPEGLETGPYIINQRNANETLLETAIIIGSTVDFNDTEFAIYDIYETEVKEFNNTSGGVYNGIFSGVKYFKVTPSQAKEILKTLANTGQSDSVVSLFLCPTYFVPATIPEGGKYPEVTPGNDVDKGGWNTGFVEGEEENYKPTALNGYTPRNKKLLTYPYCYMLMSNNAGANAIYQYELFNDPDNPNLCPFRIYSSVTPGMSIRIVPLHYNGAARNNDEGLNLGKFPVCSWSNDAYTNWLTQNSVNVGVSIATGVGMAAAGIGAIVASGGIAALGMAGAIGAGGGILGGIGAVGSTLGQVHQQSFTPPQAQGNTNNGDVNYSAGYLTFTAHQMTIKREYAKIIDEFFDSFGYKVNRVKVPNSNHRKNYWYTKTIDANIDGGKIPQNEMLKIKECYNKGITFWKNPENFGDYSVNNDIV